MKVPKLSPAKWVQVIVLVAFAIITLGPQLVVGVAAILWAYEITHGKSDTNMESDHDPAKGDPM